MPRIDISQTTPKQQKEILKYAAEFYKSEVDNFWKRSVFYWGLIAAAFVAYAALNDKENAKPLMLLIACFGLVCSTAWTLLNRGSKYWYEAWEQKVLSIERTVLGVALFTHVEPLIQNGWWGAAGYSVSRLTIALSDFAVLMWIVLGLRTLLEPIAISSGCYTAIALVGTGVYVAMLLIGCRSRPREKTRPPQYG